MHHHIGFFHRAKDTAGVVTYGTLAITGAFTTVVLGTANLALAATIIGYPAALFFSSLTFVSAAGTSFAVSKTSHKAHLVAGLSHWDDSKDNARHILSINRFTYPCSGY